MPPKPREHSTRNAILRLIKTAGPVAIQQISHALGITSMAVRRHVRLLEKAGLVTSEREHRPRGRPADLLRLTPCGDNFFPKTYDRFALEMLQAIATLDGPEKVEHLFQERKDRLVAQYAPRLAGRGREGRVRETVRILCADGYMAESHRLNSHTFLVTEHNCAIAQIAHQLPQACHAELCFLAQALGADVHRQSHVLQGDRECSYLIQFPTHRKPAAKSVRSS